VRGSKAHLVPIPVPRPAPNGSSASVSAPVSPMSDTRTLICPRCADPEYRILAHCPHKLNGGSNVFAATRCLRLCMQRSSVLGRLEVYLSRARPDCLATPDPRAPATRCCVKIAPRALRLIHASAISSFALRVRFRLASYPSGHRHVCHRRGGTAIGRRSRGDTIDPGL